MKPETRDTMRRVMRQAVSTGVGANLGTDLLFGAGVRESVARTYTGYEINRITEWNEDIDAAHINWPLSATTGFKEKLVVEYHSEVRIEWRIVSDCSLTMDFGTVELKRFTAAVLSTIFALSAQGTKDSVGQIIYDEFDRRMVLSSMSGSELLGVGLPVYLEST